MKGFASRFFLAAGVLLLTSVAASAQIVPFSWWKNDKGSILSIWTVTGTTFTGTFTNYAAGFSCQGIPYPAAGTVYPNGFVRFSVNFAACNTVTTWWGRVIGPKMPTKWVLIYKGRRMTGADLFTRL